jgi:hypothetical protein
MADHYETLGVPRDADASTILADFGYDPEQMAVLIGGGVFTFVVS